MSAPLTHKDFLGVWSIRREIAQVDGACGVFSGKAEITNKGAQWLYVEQGTLTLGAHTGRAERTYIWVPEENGFDVLFDDGRPFHPLRFEGGEATHWCDPDQYDVTYEFSLWPRWQAVWRVKGPRKDYEMRNAYSRI